MIEGYAMDAHDTEMSAALVDADRRITAAEDHMRIAQEALSTRVDATRLPMLLQHAVDAAEELQASEQSLRTIVRLGTPEFVEGTVFPRLRSLVEGFARFNEGATDVNAWLRIVRNAGTTPRSGSN
jgi:hypothetical protein